MVNIEKGDFIRIKYVGRLESGEVFDLTDEDIAKKEGIYSPKVKYGPIPVIVGGGFVLPGLDKELLSMSVSEKKSVSIASKDAFGDRNPELIKIVPQKAFKDQKIDPKQGMIVDFGGMKGRIQSASPGRVTVDFNNPLAGKNLKYDVEIVEKIENPAQQVKGVYDFFGAFSAQIDIEDKEVVVKAPGMPQELRQRLANIVLENVKGMEQVIYKEIYKKQSKGETHVESQ